MKYPVLIYDNLCTSCTVYAKNANRILGGKITMMGHYTPECKEFKKTIFPENYEGLEMSWFVTETKAYGGRKGLQKLIKYMLSPKKGEFPENNFDLDKCDTECRNVKGTMVRSYSLFSTSREIEIQK